MKPIPLFEANDYSLELSNLRDEISNIKKTMKDRVEDDEIEEGNRLLKDAKQRLAKLLKNDGIDESEAKPTDLKTVFMNKCTKSVAKIIAKDQGVTKDIDWNENWLSEVWSLVFDTLWKDGEEQEVEDMLQSYGVID